MATNNMWKSIILYQFIRPAFRYDRPLYYGKDGPLARWFTKRKNFEFQSYKAIYLKLSDGIQFLIYTYPTHIGEGSSKHFWGGILMGFRLIQYGTGSPIFWVDKPINPVAWWLKCNLNWTSSNRSCIENMIPFAYDNTLIILSILGLYIPNAELRDCKAWPTDLPDSAPVRQLMRFMMVPGSVSMKRKDMY